MICERCGNTNIQVFERGNGVMRYRCTSCEREWN